MLEVNKHSLNQLSFDMKRHSLNVTTVTPTHEEPAWLIDDKIMQILLSTIAPTTLDQTKESLIHKINASEDSVNLVQFLEEFITIQKFSLRVRNIEIARLPKENEL